MDDKRITYFAQTDSRNKKTPFGIKAIDRTKHVYVIGKTGMGKSTLLENMAVQDIQNGEGLCFIDPHGKTAELLLEYIPEHRKNDVLYFAPFDLEHPVSFNVMEDVGYDKRHLVASGLMSIFKKIWQDAWSARMEHILNNTLLALLEYPGSTLMGVNRMFADKEYRKRVVDNIKDPSVKSFWVDEFAKYTDKFAAEATPAIQNKIGQFTSNPLIRNIISQPKSSFDIRKIMDEKKIMIVNLSKGRVGETSANLLGGMIITKIYLAAMSRADIPDRVLRGLPNFYLFVDEFQSFANESFADILSEARKYKLNLTIAHQYIEQMEDEVRAAVFGNVGTMIVFRVGAYDAEVLEKEFAPQFTAEDIVNLGAYQIYLKLMIDGISSQPFSASTLPAIKEPAVKYIDHVIEASRQNFSKPRGQVEEDVRQWSMPLAPIPKDKPEPSKGAQATVTPASAPTSAKPGAPAAFVPKKVIAPNAAGAVASKPYVPPSKPIEKKAPATAQPFAKAFKELEIDRTSSPKVEPNSDQEPEVKPEPKPKVEPKPEPKQQIESKSNSKPVEPRVEQKPAEDSKPVAVPKPKPAAEEILEPRPEAKQVVAEKPMSLNELKPSIPKKTEKGPTEKNLNDLRSALAAVMKTESKPAPQPVKEKKVAENDVSNVPAPSPSASIKSTPSEKAKETPAEVKPAPEQQPQVPPQTKDNQTNAGKNKPAEIPENVLKNMLKVDGEDVK